MIVFHGRKRINNDKPFTLDYIDDPRCNHEKGPGIYLTDSLEVAGYFSGQDGVIITSTLTGIDLMDLPLSTFTPELIEDLLEKKDNIEEILADWGFERKEAMSELVENIMDQDTPYDIFISLWAEAYMHDPKNLLKHMQELGVSYTTIPEEQKIPSTFAVAFTPECLVDIKIEPACEKIKQKLLDENTSELSI
ncbi:hypothetical protein [Neptuniibacter sp. QD37_11]|uniref:hypothetical protein n=1 Tax=Neptuniibacter sp. QD37_11 TaxID=3398209 RepID=UPI0039F49E11